MEGRSDRSSKFELANDIWSSVFELLSAYDLASLYFTGAKHIQDTLSKRATRFDLRYDAYRRIAWPRNFLPLLPALQHVTIGGHDTHSYLRVPDADVSQLPRGLLTLELHIANGLLSLVNPSKMKEMRENQLHLLPLESMYPGLQHLAWTSLLHDVKANPMKFVFDTLPQSHLRSLKISLPTFALDEFNKFPTTLEELSIDSPNWVAGHSILPSQLIRLELLHVSTSLRFKAWPPNLSHLHIDYDSHVFDTIASIDNILKPVALPSSLKSFYLNAPLFFIDAPFCAMIPSGLEDIRIYVPMIMHEATEDFANKVTSLVQLKTLHCCITIPPDNMSTMFFDNMPPNLVEFVATSGANPRKPWEAANIPKSLRTLCSTPVTCFGTQPTQRTYTLGERCSQPSHDARCFPHSLLELEDTIVNHRSFPPTLTRLSVQAYSYHLLPTNFDYSAVLLPPLITDLSLCLTGAFDVLKQCEALPLISLDLDLHSPGCTQSAREAATAFDLRCFTRLETLIINPLFVLPTERAAWLERLPPSLTALSLVPIRLQWTVKIHLASYLESWIVFPSLPRGLRKFAASISDLHVQEVFASLPADLTELYLHGYLELGTFGQFDLDLSMPSPYALQAIELDSHLPLSLAKLMLPYGAIHSKPSNEFFSSRPQLSITVWDPNLTEPTRHFPAAYNHPTNRLLMPTTFGAVLESLDLSLEEQQALSETDVGFHCTDRAIRSPATRLTEMEMKLMQQAVAMLQKGGQPLGAIHKWVFAKRQQLMEKQKKSDSKNSNCAIS